MRCYLLLLCLLLSGCAGYSNKIRGPRNQFEAGQYDQAAEEIKALADKRDNDLILYLLDLGMVLHTAGKYEEAVKVFLEAEKITEIKDYTNIAEETATVILNEEVKEYRAEYFEHVLINIYLAIDFTMLKKYEDALVECRKVNHKIDRLTREGKLKLDHNAFAKYLAAALFESQRELNDAFVDYRVLLKWAEKFPYLPQPLLRIADRLQFTQEFAEYKKLFPKVTDYKLGKNEGEVILLLEVGKAPIKVPNPEFNLLPKFVRNGGYSVENAVLRDSTGKFKAPSYTLYDIEASAIKELDDKMAGLIAKKIGGVVAKQVIAAGVEKATDSKAAGFLTAVLLHATDKADLRSWTTAPARLQLARLKLPAGRHDIVLDRFSTNREDKGIKLWPQVEVPGGKAVFLNHRIME